MIIGSSFQSGFASGSSGVRQVAPVGRNLTYQVYLSQSAQRSQRKDNFFIAGDPASVGTFGDGGNKKQARRCRAPTAEGLRCYEKSASHRFFIKISPFSAISANSSEAGERQKLPGVLPGKEPGRRNETLSLNGTCCQDSSRK